MYIKFLVIVTTRPKFAKVMFLQVSVCPQGGACVVVPGGGMCGEGGVHGEGGVCMVKGGRVWQRGGVRDEGGHTWRRGGMCGKEGVCGKGGHVWHAPSPRDTAGHCAGGTHPTGMHSCSELNMTRMKRQRLRMLRKNGNVFCCRSVCSDHQIIPELWLWHCSSHLLEVYFT